MAFQSAPGIAEAVITYTGHGQTFKNIVHGFMSSPYGLADLTALAAAVDQAVGDNWRPLQSLDYLYLNTTVRGLESMNDQEVLNDDTSGVGAKDANAFPDNVTISIKKASGLTGRSARGRLYWIGTHDEDIASNENSYIASQVVLIVAAVDTVRVAIDATVWEATIMSRFTGNLERPWAVPFRWTDTVAVNNDVDSQRRRLIN